MKNRPEPTVNAARIDQARAALTPLICYAFLDAVLNNGKVLDKTLTAFFRENKRFGSHDRRFISAVIFALLRYWGYARKTVTPDDPAQWTNLTREQVISNPKYVRPILAAYALDGHRCEGPARVWANACEIKPEDLNWQTLNLKEKSAAMAAVFKCTPPNTLSLFPPFFESMLPPQTDIDRLAEILQKRPPLYLRLQTPETEKVLALLCEDGLEAVVHGKIPTALKICDNRVNLYETHAFQQGLVEVQDVGSQCISHVCAPKRGERWLDYCAGAGGKTLHLADLMQGKGTVVATDKRNWKLEDLRKRVKRAGFQNIMVKESTGAFPKVNAESFDGVLVDAPCSCTGTWRRNPDARWTLKESEIDELSALQLDILAHAAKAVKHGGVLIYATCSLCVKENEENVQKFLQAHPDFTSEPFINPLTHEMCEEGFMRVDPFIADSDCMFAARFRRK